MRNLICTVALGVMSMSAVFGEDLKNGTFYPLEEVPAELIAKFSFGTNNFDPTPKDLSRWLEAIAWLDLKASDIWTPADLKR